MTNYIKSENLKIKHSFLKKLLFLAPLTILVFSYVAQLGFFVQNTINDWYVYLLPVVIALNCCLQVRMEERYKNKAILSLPVNLRKVYFAKIIVGIRNMACSTGIVVLGCFVASFIYKTKIPLLCTKTDILFSGVVMVILSLWMVPFFYYFAGKFGIFINMFLAFGLAVTGVICAVTKFWWANPFSYISRAMCPVLKILPNGLVACEGSETFKPELLQADVVIISGILSLVLFVLLLFVTSRKFVRQEAV